MGQKVAPWKLFALTAALPQLLEPWVFKFPSKWGAVVWGYYSTLLGLPRLVLLLEHSRTPIPFTTEAANPSTHSYNSNNNSSSQNKNQKEKNRTKNKYNTKKQEKKLIIWVGIESRGIHKKIIKEFQFSFLQPLKNCDFPSAFPGGAGRVSTCQIFGDANPSLLQSEPPSATVGGTGNMLLSAAFTGNIWQLDHFI